LRPVALALTQVFPHFFLKQVQNLCLNLFTKKKRDAQLINGEQGENLYILTLLFHRNDG
jgi:hypothetical protein